MGWITKKGAHIFIGDNGTVIKGAKSLIGKSFGGKTYKCTQTNFDPHSVNWNKYQRTVSAMSAEAEFNKKADEYLAKKKREDSDKKANDRFKAQVVVEYGDKARVLGIDPSSVSDESKLDYRESRAKSSMFMATGNMKLAVERKDKKALANAREQEHKHLQELFNIQTEKKALLESQGKDTSKVDKQLSETSAKLKPSEVRKNPSKYSIHVIKSAFRAEFFWFQGFYHSNLDKFNWALQGEAEKLFLKYLQQGKSYKDAASSAIKDVHKNMTGGRK